MHLNQSRKLPASATTRTACSTISVPSRVCNPASIRRSITVRPTAETTTHAASNTGASHIAACKISGHNTPAAPLNFALTPSGSAASDPTGSATKARSSPSRATSIVPSVCAETIFRSCTQTTQTAGPPYNHRQSTSSPTSPGRRQHRPSVCTSDCVPRMGACVPRMLLCSHP